MYRRISMTLKILVIMAALAGGAARAADMMGLLTRTTAPENSVWLDSLIQDKSKTDAGVALCYNGGPLMYGNRIFAHGIGLYPSGALLVNLNGAAKKFAAMVYIGKFTPDNSGVVVFEIWADGKKIAESQQIGAGDAPELMSVSVAGVQTLWLYVRGVSGTRASAEWGGALLALDPAAATKPEIATFKDEPAMPIAHTDLDAPGIHGPRIVGSTPGRPFLFRIPATGKPPLQFSADNLPAGLALDPDTGIISGSLKRDGATLVTLKVYAANGEAARALRIAGGAHKLALTPPMGWNSWNVWGTAVDDAKVRAAADAMHARLANFGYRYVNIDDAWEAGRDANGEILSNEKFPDMKALADYVHSKGLLIGLYSSPGPLTCARYEASYQHEYQDAATWAKWGFDYIKYDWCSYGGVVKGNTLEEYAKPYKLMSAALDAVDRDIVHSFCQYGMGQVWEWGAATGGNLWRTTGDINDSWSSMAGIGFTQNGLEKFAGPGHWNDPDMLVVGQVGWGPRVHPTRLTPNEQITHITLWSILASPLLIGCDMPAMDQFTFDILTNTEVIDVNQDPLGKQGRRVAEPGILLEAWARPLYDGTIAVGLFNRFVAGADVTVTWEQLGLSGPQPVRDLWRREDLGTFDGAFTATVPAHGAVLIKIGKPDANAQP